MCIDLAGTEYIRKIHYLGSKMEDAKGTVITGLRAGEYILKHRGWVLDAFNLIKILLKRHRSNKNS